MTKSFGHFDDARREYVITEPETPSPWINYLGSEDFFGLISNTGGGYCFYRDARLRRILRYRYNAVPQDSSGRYFYVRDAGEIWTPGFLPARTELDHYECRHGLGYTQITGRRRELEVQVLSLVPPGEHAEVHRVRLHNQSTRARTIDLVSYVEFCLYNAHDDATNLQRNLSTGEVEVEAGGRTLYHVTEYRERRNHYAFYGVNADVTGFDTDRDSFLGGYGSTAAPAALKLGRASSSVASGFAPIASHWLTLSLAPGEQRELCFVLGYVENDERDKWARPGVANKHKAHALLSRFTRSEQVDAAMAALAERWNELLAAYQVKSKDPALDRTVNVWNPYQCIVTFNIARSASFYETGIGRGIGFRDSNQDVLGAVHMVPERARQRILDLAATQFPDGSAYHQYQPLTKRGNHDIGSGFNDDPLWLILSTVAYVQETGDIGVLEERVPFDHDPKLAAPLLTHLARSFGHVVERLGPHRLPLIGRADWNDCLNLNCFSTTPDESFQTTGDSHGPVAESLMIAGMFVFAGDKYVELLEQLGRVREAAEARTHISAMRKAVLEHGVDGDWFLRAYDATGKKVGSRENQEGKIFIESQAFCAMAEIGREQGLSLRALDSVREHLDTPFGLVLHSPSFTRYHEELGEISSYPPGYKENGGIFCHNNPWVMIAEAIHGRGDTAFGYFKKLTPSYLENHALRRTEPYVYAQMVAGRDAKNFGQAKNSWLTGAAAWHLVAAAHYLLGIRPELTGLRVQPTIARELGAFEVTRRCRGALYVIRVEPRTDGTSGMRLFVGGKPADGNLVPYAPAGSTVEVRCEA